MINFYNPVIKKKEVQILNRTIKAGWISSQGKVVREFEKKFASWHKVKDKELLIAKKLRSHIRY